MNEKSPHILNAATNLLGFCFVVLTSLKVLHVAGESRIDELTGITMIFLMASVVFSFFSIRSRNTAYERVADICFMIAISSLFITTVVVTFDLIK